MKSSILTASGDYFDLLNPAEQQIRIRDIAASLSKTCRYGGHCKDFYSVAQHSVLVSQVVPPEYALAGLLHDGAEAYAGDIVKPLKVLLDRYGEIEGDIERAVFRRFRLPEELPECVKTADVILLRTEQRDIMHNRDVWHWTEGVEPLAQRIRPWGHRRARRVFLRRFRQLTNTTTRLDRVLIAMGALTL